MVASQFSIVFFFNRAGSRTSVSINAPMKSSKDTLRFIFRESACAQSLPFTVVMIEHGVKGSRRLAGELRPDEASESRFSETFVSDESGSQDPIHKTRINHISDECTTIGACFLGLVVRLDLDPTLGFGLTRTFKPSCASGRVISEPGDSRLFLFGSFVDFADFGILNGGACPPSNFFGTIRTRSGRVDVDIVKRVSA